jgi:hypothetical protein
MGESGSETLAFCLHSLAPMVVSDKMVYGKDGHLYKKKSENKFFPYLPISLTILIHVFTCPCTQTLADNMGAFSSMVFILSWVSSDFW